MPSSATYVTTSEDAHQAAFFRWAVMNEMRYPDLRKMYAVPNGGHRNKVVAAKLKAQGVRAGVLDISLDVARQGFHGLRIEMKKPADKVHGKRAGELSGEQLERFADLWADGYRAEVCFGWQEAVAVVQDYLS